MWLDTGADAAIEHSIITNLPIKRDLDKISCYFENTFVKCRNIGGFFDKGIEYFIGVKLWYSSTAASPTNFGGIKIVSIVKDLQ